jgi:hypothetical protein
MRNLGRNPLVSRTFLPWLGGLAVFVALATSLVSCGGNTPTTGAAGGTSSSTPSTGSIAVSLSDPPSCKFPHGTFEHVYVTIRSVQANPSYSADDNSPGWQELAPQLNAAPMQIDLFGQAPNSCLRATLGSNSAFPAGMYQAMRVLLVANSGAIGPLPMTNACAGQGFNCVVLHDGSVHQLQPTSDSNTGLKIPINRIFGQPISVGVGQDVDLNINFNACASIVLEASGQYRLNPAIWAYKVNTNNDSISGKVIDASTGAPVAVGATGAVLVALEGDDVPFSETVADSSGNFNFCPLPPPPGFFDVVAVAVNGNGAAYNPTITLSVPVGTNLSPIPVNIETGSPNTPAIFHGVVTASGGSASIDVTVSGAETISYLPIGSRWFTMPAEAGSSVLNISVASNAPCPSGAPLNANCATYTLIESPSNPRVAPFTTGTISYPPPPPGAVIYVIRLDAFVPLSGGKSSCSPSSKQMAIDMNGNLLAVVPGMTVQVNEIDFTGCS